MVDCRTSVRDWAFSFGFQLLPLFRCSIGSFSLHDSGGGGGAWAYSSDVGVAIRWSEMAWKIASPREWLKHA